MRLASLLVGLATLALTQPTVASAAPAPGPGRAVPRPPQLRPILGLPGLTIPNTWTPQGGSLPHSTSIVALGPYRTGAAVIIATERGTLAMHRVGTPTEDWKDFGHPDANQVGTHACVSLFQPTAQTDVIHCVATVGRGLWLLTVQNGKGTWTAAGGDGPLASTPTLFAQQRPDGKTQLVVMGTDAGQGLVVLQGEPSPIAGPTPSFAWGAWRQAPLPGVNNVPVKIVRPACPAWTKAVAPSCYAVAPDLQTMASFSYAAGTASVGPVYSVPAPFGTHASQVHGHVAFVRAQGTTKRLTLWSNGATTDLGTEAYLASCVELGSDAAPKRFACAVEDHSFQVSVRGFELAP